MQQLDSFSMKGDCHTPHAQGLYTHWDDTLSISRNSIEHNWWLPIIFSLALS